MCLVAWPLNKSAAVVDLALLTDGVIMPISWNLHEKSRGSEVSIKTRSTLGLLSCKGQATKRTTLIRP